MDRSDPEAMFEPEINFVVGKKQLGKIIDKCITNARLRPNPPILLDWPSKDLGYHVPSTHRLPDRRHRRYDGAQKKYRS